MYTSVHPSQHYALMHGTVRPSVSRQLLNSNYHHPRDDSLFPAFTCGQDYNLTPIPETPSGPSHDTESGRGHHTHGYRHNIHTHGQPGTWGAPTQMTGRLYPPFITSNPNLDGSLLCSSWSAQRLRTPSPQLPATDVSAFRVEPHSVSRQTMQQPLWSLDASNIVQPPEQEQDFESGSSVLAYPTPGVTPISAVESTPSHSVVFSADGYLEMTPPQYADPAYWQNRQQSHQIPLPLDSLQGSAGQFSAPYMLEASADHPNLHPDDTEVPAVFLCLPASISGTNTEAAFGQYSDANEFQLQGAVAASLEPVDDWTVFYDTVYASDLGSLDNFASNLDDVDSIINSIAGDAQSAPFPDNGDTFGVLTNADVPPPLTATATATITTTPAFNDLNLQAQQPLIPEPVLATGESSQGTFEDVFALATENIAEAGGAVLPGHKLNREPSMSTSSGFTYGERRRGSGRRNTSRDEELLQLRMRGVPYRDIKYKYGFDVAESTLRGRIRSLTKAKEQRVRKPVWKAEDVSLLCSCVIEFAIQNSLPADVVGSLERPVLLSDQSINKLSWKRVAETMAERGSYRYGNATVKKKYKEVRNEQLMNLVPR